MSVDVAASAPTTHAPQSMRAGAARSLGLPSKPEGYVLGKKIGNRVWRATVALPPTAAAAALTASTPLSGPATSADASAGAGGAGEERHVVVKTVQFDVTKNPAKTAKVEAALEHFKALAHAHVVKSLHSFYVDKELWVIEEPTGWEDDTLRALSAHDAAAPLPEPVLAALCRQVLTALQYVHASGRAWSDVRGKNMFVQRDGHVVINLVTLRSVVQEKTRDSLPFVAPELLGAQASEFNTSGKGDIWSLGIALLELANNQTPYTSADSTPQQITQRILNEPPPPLRDDVEWQWTNVFADFLSRCLVRDPQQRATAEELLHHPFITSAPPPEYLVTHLLALYEEENAAPTPVPTPVPAPISTPSPGLTNMASPVRHSTPPPNADAGAVTHVPVDAPAGPGSRRSSDPTAPTFVAPPMVKLHSDSSVPTPSGPSRTSYPAPTSASPTETSPLMPRAASHAAGATSTAPSTAAPANAATTATQPGTLTVPMVGSQPGAGGVARSASAAPAHPHTVVQLSAGNVPVETCVAESAHEFVVFVRTLPSTKVALRLESRTLLIAGELPPLQWAAEQGLPEDMVLLDPVQSKFERRLVFSSDIDPNSVRKQLDKESSLMTIRIRKFSHRDLGYEQF